MAERVHWLDSVAAALERREDAKIVFSTAKTPSGPIHIGFGRELVYCSVLERMLREKGRVTEFLFFVDDFDSLKNFPPNIPKDFASHREYVGKPLYTIPCPYNHCRSYAEHYSQELIETFPSFGLHPKIYRTHEVYQVSEMKNLIRTALDNVEKLRNIMIEIVSPTLQGDMLQNFLKEMSKWYPAMAVCENCGRLKSAEVTGWEATADTVQYRCGECGYVGNVKVSSWPVKLRWRIDWPAKWAAFKVSCEPAGKDHCVKGGAYDTGEAILREVFKGNPPYRIQYEWILLGEKAMKTHRGVSFTFNEWLHVAPAEVYRYLLLREDPKKHINFAPERLLQLIDEFEKLERVYFGLERLPSEAEERVFKRLYQLSMPEKAPSAMPKRLPYRFAVIITQLSPLFTVEKIREKCIRLLKKLYGIEEVKVEELNMLDERLRMAEYWVSHYAPEELRIEIADTIPVEIREKLGQTQREALSVILDKIQEKEWDEESLQYEIFETGKRLGLGSKIFQTFYLVFLGKKFGPRLGPFLLSLEKDFIVKRINEALRK